VKGRWVLVAVVALAVFCGLLVYLTAGSAKYRVEACVEFRGATSCRTASGATREAALRAAVSNACALIASGMSDTMACEKAVPKDVRWLKP
jgi:opacity protein-like surface antigen